MDGVDERGRHVVQLWKASICDAAMESLVGGGEVANGEQGEKKYFKGMVWMKGGDKWCSYGKIPHVLQLWKAWRQKEKRR
ncbi:hypothetical protein GOP47_0017367 [Adiantum capillus-veneris]|uniref:Uncharacterized protein n=1 Tax=Adiantum capillus-veneris TaxID=13818 RepID=A0A9D4UGA0_ADICA|nr:hypothetical protein GOP47_0017367 [Adiantum capillus-veneris]